MLDEIRQRIEVAIADAKSPAVLFSGGKDSLLLLALARELRNDLWAIWFRTGESDVFTRQVLHDWDVPALSWSPADVYLLGQDTDRALVHEYDFDGIRLPVVTDLTPGATCSRTLPQLSPTIHPGFDVLLWGAKDTDTHWLKGNILFPPDGTLLGDAKLFAPLRHLTDEQVRAAIENLELDYTEQPDSLPMCSACFGDTGEVYCPRVGHAIPTESVDWEAGVNAFRNRFVQEAV